ncbi:hypothetical protein [Streptomyces sp. NPDC059080]|uniref:hypothetical protein n=1 Tax=Streptomyces sp. NPDC059080 TaxID=3346718 RepID=UPI00367EDEA4
MDTELPEWITVRRGELDELEERLAKESAKVRDERDEHTVAERTERRDARPSPREPAFRGHSKARTLTQRAQTALPLLPPPDLHCRQ